MGGGGSSGGTPTYVSQPTNTSSTTTQYQNPWSGIQSDITGSVGIARNMMDWGQSIYPYVYQPSAGWSRGSRGDTGQYYNMLTGETQPYGTTIPYTSTVAPLNPLQNLALEETANLAATGSPVLGANQAMLTQTARGDFLNPSTNPFLEATYNQASDAVTRNYLNAVTPGLNAAATRAGAFGGSQDTLLKGEAQHELGQSLQNLATNVYGTNYSQERANQLKASLLGPQYAQAAYADPQALLGVGDVYQQQQQQETNAAMNQWAAQSANPYERLANYIGSLSGSGATGFGSSSSTNTGTGYSPYSIYPTGGSSVGNILGGAGLGLGLLSFFL